jgi:hypothetical protein
MLHVCTGSNLVEAYMVHDGALLQPALGLFLCQHFLHCDGATPSEWPQEARAPPTVQGSWMLPLRGAHNRLRRPLDAVRAHLSDGLRQFSTLIILVC